MTKATIMKNLAGNDVYIFLYRFVILDNGIDFVLNEAIAHDLTPDIERKLKPCAHACAETLQRYRHLCSGNVIMDGNILVTGEFEVMLSKGLGKYFANVEKSRLFEDANNIANLLQEVMSQNSSKDGISAKHKSEAPLDMKQSLENMGKKQRLESELKAIAEGKTIRPGIKKMSPDDLPEGITATCGYDHRGTCYLFEHKTEGELGRIVLISSPNGQTQMQSELFLGSNPSNLEIKKAIFGEVVSAISNHFDEQFVI